MSIWAARDKSGNLFFYDRMPRKGREVWYTDKGAIWHFINRILPEVKWEDEKPSEVEFIIKK